MLHGPFRVLALLGWRLSPTSLRFARQSSSGSMSARRIVTPTRARRARSGGAPSRPRGSRCPCAACSARTPGLRRRARTRVATQPCPRSPPIDRMLVRRWTIHTSRSLALLPESDAQTMTSIAKAQCAELSTVDTATSARRARSAATVPSIPLRLRPSRSSWILIGGRVSRPCIRTNVATTSSPPP
jgi:hypothetical protein